MDIVSEIRRLGDRVAHIHLKDLEDDEFVELGKGTLPLEKFLNTLRDLGYSGWMTIELDATPDPEESAKISVDYVQGLVA